MGLVYSRCAGWLLSIPGEESGSCLFQEWSLALVYSRSGIWVLSIPGVECWVLSISGVELKSFLYFRTGACVLSIPGVEFGSFVFLEWSIDLVYFMRET